MSLIIVGVADCQVTNNKEAVLVTYALGSCIGVLVHDPIARIGGMLHYMLPASTIDPAKANANPFLFADTGIPRLFQNCYRLGAEKRRLVVTVVGGAHVLDLQGTFNIGKRNHLSLRKILWKAGVLIHTEDVGGNVSRTVRLEVGTGRVLLRKGEQPEQELKNASRSKVSKA
jgi:chemotaxis protein CheD